MTAPPGAAARRYHQEFGSRLPRPAGPGTARTAVPAPRSFPHTPLHPLNYPPAAEIGPGAQLGDLLGSLYGVTRLLWSIGGVTAARPVPSGGGVYPCEVYVAAPRLGLAHYLPTAHALEQLSGADRRAEIVGRLADPPVGEPALVLVLSCARERNTVRYGEFGRRLQVLDTGVLAGQALALWAAAGLTAQLHSRFDEAGLAELLGLDPAVESVRAVVTTGPAEVLPAAPPLATAPPAAAPPATAPRAAAFPASAFGERRSARGGFHPVAVSRAELDAVLAAARVTDSGDGAIDGFAGIEPYCLVNRVEGVAPGCYRHDPGSGQLHRVGDGPPPGALFPVGPSAVACYEAAFAVLVTGDYERGYPRFGDRWYRMQNLAAGIAGQRVCLAAAAQPVPSRAAGRSLGSRLHCDFLIEGADALLGEAAGSRTTLLVALVGPAQVGSTPEQQPGRPAGARTADTPTADTRTGGAGRW
ncbi:nitroreductase family protein [Kitasatospora sp. NBC_01266]|uniref:nitroreductase family protein n=1 Tax=Kitasatospora sp. NBC_01266 TaxID=2903572 RepID=UPI002E371D5F|nr:nitroreductase family protein [Kitasatospora sp. NBC_01266]